MLGLEQLDAREREALAAEHGAPSASVTVLERHLLAPIQVRRRVATLSEEASELLKHLIEAALPALPLEGLKSEAVEELRGAWLVSLGGAPAQVSVSEPVAVASLEGLDAVPCRLRLMLADERLLGHLEARCGGSVAELEARLAEALGEPASRSGVPRGARIAAWLGDRRAVERVVAHLAPEGAALLWDLVAAGGVMERPREESPSWVSLMALGLLWESDADVRIPAEVLRALLEVRLEERATAALEVARQLRQSGVLETVHPIPIDTAREIAELVRVMWSGGPGRRWSRDELRHETRRRPLESGLHEALLELLVALGVVASAEGGYALSGPPSVERGSLAWATALVEQAAKASASGWASRPAREALLGLLGIEAPDEVPREVPDEAELEGWAAMPPHMLDTSTREFSESAGASLSVAWLGLLLVGQLARLQAGRRYPLRGIGRLLRSLLAVVHTIVRLDGPLYMRDAAARSTSRCEEAAQAWLGAQASPLGWIAQVEATGAERVGETLSLLDVLEEPAPAAVDEVTEVRVLRRIPQHPPRVERPWRVLLGGLMSGGSGRGRNAQARLAGLSEEGATFLEERGSNLAGQDLAPELFASYLREQTRASRLAEVTERDVERFFVFWMWRLTPAEGRTRVRSFLDAVEGMLRWAAESGEPVQVEPDLVRERLEGPLLRLCSAWDAFSVYHRTVPPPQLLKLKPRSAWDGLVEVLACELSEGAMVAQPRRGGAAVGEPLRVLTNPRPLALLRPGDLIDAQLVRYGDVCWVTVLRRLWLHEAMEFMEEGRR